MFHFFLLLQRVHHTCRSALKSSNLSTTTDKDRPFAGHVNVSKLKEYSGTLFSTPLSRTENRQRLYSPAICWWTWLPRGLGGILEFVPPPASPPDVSAGRCFPDCGTPNSVWRESTGVPAQSRTAFSPVSWPTNTPSPWNGNPTHVTSISKWKALSNCL